MCIHYSARTARTLRSPTAAVAPARGFLRSVRGVPRFIESAITVAANDLEIDLLVDRLLLYESLQLAFQATMDELAQAAQIDEVELAGDVHGRVQIAEFDLFAHADLHGHGSRFFPLRPVQVGLPADEEIVAELVDLDVHHP